MQVVHFGISLVSAADNAPLKHAFYYYRRAAARVKDHLGMEKTPQMWTPGAERWESIRCDTPRHVRTGTHGSLASGGGGCHRWRRRGPLLITVAAPSLRSIRPTAPPAPAPAPTRRVTASELHPGDGASVRAAGRP